MSFSWTKAALFAATAVAASIPAGGRLAGREGKPPAFFLAGDSTTAVNGGWGDGLLAPLIEPAWGLNIGLSGATTASFVARGNWANVTSHLKEYAEEYDVYVTISFGHNDQKPENNVPFDTYQQNLINFANEVKSLGGTPVSPLDGARDLPSYILAGPLTNKPPRTRPGGGAWRKKHQLLVSSLTRRVFPSDPHNATDSLHNERLAAIAAAAATGSAVVDLNAASLAYVNAIGRDAAWAYNWGDDRKDTTHLNPWGEVVFGRMVADLVIRAEPGLEAWFTPNATLSEAIWNNLPA
ncbi:putative carbohydrate esterase family 12 protein [Rosellinia necatrix]|uniref:Putative carbohydrate esterase family 12 protein n=1 Tax=Rosellinia necatrix TaxID=77044 RepID=A0A1W2TTH7_ROSNE|nr:putative carbohydrate esterase family 12 protein [Rosellinia necatrix]